MHVLFIHRCSQILLCAAILIMAAHKGIAQNSEPRLNLVWSGLRGGFAPQMCALQRGAGYVASLHHLYTVDLSDPDRPRISDTIPLAGTKRQMEVVDDTLLIVACDSAITLFSLQDSFNPQKLSTIPVENSPKFVAYNGFLYVTTYSKTTQEGVFEVFNIIKPSQPIRSTQSKNIYPFGSLRRINDFLLIGTLQIDAITYRIVKILPNGELEGGSFWVPPFYSEHGFVAHDSTALFLGRVGSNSYVFSIVFHEDRLPTTQWYQTTVTSDYQAAEFAASDIRTLFTCVPTKSSRALVGYGSQSMLIGSGRSDTLRVGANVVRQSHPNRGWAMHTQVVDSTAIWITSTGFYVATITQEGEIIDRGSISTSKNCLAVDGRGNRAVALMEQEMLVLDLLDPRNPVVQGSLPITADGIRMISETEAVTYDSVITLIDLSEPNRPVVRSRHSLGENIIANNIAWNGEMLAAACLDSGTYIMRMQGLIEPVVHIPALGTDVVWKNDTLIVAEIDTLASVWDISIATTPQLLSLLSDKADSPKGYRIARGWGLGIIEDYLLVGRYGEALIFNINKASEPSFIGESTFNSGVAQWQSAEKSVYAFNSSAGFSLNNYTEKSGVIFIKRWDLIDSADSEIPIDSYELISTLTVPSSCVRNQYVVIAGGTLGLRVCSVNHNTSSVKSEPSDNPSKSCHGLFQVMLSLHTIR
ncbi:MAG: hypothetical protein IPM61_01025 [Chlorobi bacterium]|nr:hypothetical protein [Chlorobiota bacterium]MBX7215642.1 hypothetical protein [Candidatus Kapabacteria bacterium]